MLLSDTRTNAGPDNIASFSKMFVAVADDRVITMLTSGNLATTQAVVARVFDGAGANTDPSSETLSSVRTMYDAAELVGHAIRQVCSTLPDTANDPAFDVSLLLAGQIAGRRMRLFRIYRAGNFIESTPDTPFFQIGETKYGKPILDRVASYETPLEDAVKLALISMDSTLRSNFSVGLPMDLLVYCKDSLRIAARERIGDDSAYYRSIREKWSDALRAAYRDLPTPPWMKP